jgi:mono/diheme cytochrome c family protein
MNRNSILRAAVATLILSACNIEGGLPAGDKPFVSFNRLDMDDSPATEAQEEGAQLPPVGSLHSQQHVYPFAKLAGRAPAGDTLKNPLPMTAENLAFGQRKYNTYCAPCHGIDGLGPMSKTRSDATNRGVMPGNNLTDARVYGIAKDRPGEIFHVITAGSAIMGSYAGQLEPLERWAIVHYVRTLGTAQNPPAGSQ